MVEEINRVSRRPFTTDEEREEAREEAEQPRQGFRSKITEMSEGKATLQKKKKQKKVNLKKYMHPSKKPTAITRMIPKPVNVSIEHAARNLIGVPDGVDGLKKITFFSSDNKPVEKDILFGGMRRDKNGKIKLF